MSVQSKLLFLRRVCRRNFAIIVSFVSSFLRLLMIVLFKIKRYNKTFPQNQISPKCFHNCEGYAETFMYFFKYPTSFQHFFSRLLYLSKFLVSKETVVLCWWESEAKIWFYLKSWWGSNCHRERFGLAFRASAFRQSEFANAWNVSFPGLSRW